MKHDPIPPTAAPATLQDVIDRLAGGSLPDTRKRDLRSAVVTYAKLTDRRPAAIPLDLADIRETLDGMVPAQAKVSRKRWANLRSDLAAAFDASGLRPMLRDRRRRTRRRLDQAVAGGHGPACSQRPLAFRPVGEPAPDHRRRPSTTPPSRASLRNWRRQA